MASARAAPLCGQQATSRAGTAGEAILLVEDWEFALASDMLSDVKMLDVDAAPLLDTDEAASQKAMNRVMPDIRRKAYVGWLGHTNARCKVLGWSKQELVDRANAMAREDYLLRETPSLTPRAVGFMGLKQVRNVIMALSSQFDYLAEPLDRIMRLTDDAEQGAITGLAGASPELGAQ